MSVVVSLLVAYYADIVIYSFPEVLNTYNLQANPELQSVSHLYIEINGNYYII